MSSKTPMSPTKLKNLAESYFQKKDYTKALHYYSLALLDKPTSKELKIGAMLCDLATDMEDEAHALFDYYLVARKENKVEAQSILESILLSIDTNMTLVSTIISEAAQLDPSIENGITYEEFLSVVQDKENFKEAFEDVIFSTKVILTDKNEFLSFLDLLVENGYVDIALSYIEGANAMFPLDPKIRQILGKITKQRDDSVGQE